MADLNEKRGDEKQYEKLPTLFGQEVCGKAFRLTGEPWERFKSSWDFRQEEVFARRVDPSKSASETGNFETYQRGAPGEQGEWQSADYAEFEYYEVKDGDRVFRGRKVNADQDAWDLMNFEVKTDKGWVKVDYNEIAKSSEVTHVSKLKRVMYVPVSLKEEAEIKTKKAVQKVKRVKLELTKTGYEALQKIMNALAKAGADPKTFWYTLTYVEGDKQYVIKDDDYGKLTDEELASAAAEDEGAASAPLESLKPAAENNDIDLIFT